MNTEPCTPPSFHSADHPAILGPQELTGLTGRRSLVSWSGGKDSCLALYRAHQAGAHVDTLVNSSEEFMSLYAANNILRGIRNMDPGRTLRVGLILNRRERSGDIDHVTRFSRAVGVPLLTVVPRSRRFFDAEARGCTVVEAFPDSEETALFYELVKRIRETVTGPLKPLSDEALEELVLGRRLQHAPVAGHSQGDIATTASPSKKSESIARQYLSKSLMMREPLHGCAFTGAVNTLTQIRDAATLAHGPQSCAHIVASTLLSSGLGALRRYGSYSPEQLQPALISTRMAEAAMIQGGLDGFRINLDRAADIESLRPDLCLGNYQSPGLLEICHYDTVPLRPNTGHLGGLALAQRWQQLLAAPLQEGWRRDEARLGRSLSQPVEG